MATLSRGQKKYTYGQVSSYGGTCFRKTIFLTYCEKHKVLLVVLPDAVINPGAVVVHFPYAAFANTEQEKKQNKFSTRDNEI